MMTALAALTACLIAPATHAAPRADAAAATAKTASAERRMDHISIVEMGPERAKGEPVYLIPGLSSPRAVWDGIAPQLAKARRVVLVQINGFAGDDPGANLNPGVIDGVIADILADARARGATKPAIIGHSLGGLTAMMIAARHPDRVGRVMVVDALPFFGRLFGPGATPESVKPRAEQMRVMAAGAYARAKAAAATPVTTDPGGDLSMTPEGRIRIANWAMKADMRVVAQAMFEDMTTDIGPELGRVTARPFTVLYAAGTPGAAQVWEPAYAGTPATLVAVPGSYHFIMLDQPAFFTDAVTRFLAE
ncbi:MAG: alpha/beta hydrolase [Sphingomonas sp.]|nr:alpha/beta hydrolase [Sphingomonas sp.]